MHTQSVAFHRTYLQGPAKTVAFPFNEKTTIVTQDLVSPVKEEAEFRFYAERKDPERVRELARTVSRKVAARLGTVHSHVALADRSNNGRIHPCLTVGQASGPARQS